MNDPTTPVSFRQKILDKEIKRAHAMQVRYEDLYVEAGFNLRTANALLAGEQREKAEAAGKLRVTPSSIHGRALPCKVVSPLISGVDNFFKGLDANQRAILVDIKEGRVASETITIPTVALLFQARGAVETVHSKQADKQRRLTEAAASTGKAEIPTEQEAMPWSSSQRSTKTANGL